MGILARLPFTTLVVMLAYMIVRMLCLIVAVLYGLKYLSGEEGPMDCFHTVGAAIAVGMYFERLSKAIERKHGVPRA